MLNIEEFKKKLAKEKYEEELSEHVSFLVHMRKKEIYESSHK